MSVTRTTRDWLDLYEMSLDRAFELAKDPKQAALARGITEQELADQKDIVQMPGKMQMDMYHELMKSWRSVKAALLIFGLELGDDLMVEPEAVLQVGSRMFHEWAKKPWLELSRGVDKPLHFEGRDAWTAVNFINFYIQQCETVDPTARIKMALEAQGITKETFHQHVGVAGIRNPWDNDPPKGTV